MAFLFSGGLSGLTSTAFLCVFFLHLSNWVFFSHDEIKSFFLNRKLYTEKNLLKIICSKLHLPELRPIFRVIGITTRKFTSFLPCFRPTGCRASLAWYLKPWQGKRICAATTSTTDHPQQPGIQLVTILSLGDGCFCFFSLTTHLKKYAQNITIGQVGFHFP